MSHPVFSAKQARPLWRGIVTAILCTQLGNGQPASKNETPSLKGVVRCAVIGGMTMTGLWDAISKMFEAESGYRVEVMATGQRPLLDAALREGKVDFLTMHSGDITTDLVADGFGVNMRPWTRNELCIVGPPKDPAHIRGMSDGAAAFRKIAEARAPFVDFEGIGSRELTHTLWRLAGIEPKGDWVLKDDTGSKYHINGVARTVIIQVIHYRYDNSFLASVLKRYQGTFQGVCRVDPLDAAAPDYLSKLTEQGFRGVRISPAANASGDWFSGPLMPPLLCGYAPPGC